MGNSIALLRRLPAYLTVFVLAFMSFPAQSYAYSEFSMSQFGSQGSMIGAKSTATWAQYGTRAGIFTTSHPDNLAFVNTTVVAHKANWQGWTEIGVKVAGDEYRHFAAFGDYGNINWYSELGLVPILPLRRYYYRTKYGSDTIWRFYANDTSQVVHTGYENVDCMTSTIPCLNVDQSSYDELSLDSEFSGVWYLTSNLSTWNAWRSDAWSSDYRDDAYPYWFHFGQGSQGNEWFVY